MVLIDAFTLYFDDMLIIGTNMDGVNDTKAYFSSTFQMKDLSEIDKILGVKVKRHSRGFALCQSHYIEKTLTKFNHLHIKEANTLYDVSIHLNENPGKAVARVEYASAIGSLMYVVHCTKLDIAFAVCKLFRFTKNPGVMHWKAKSRILSYLKTTKDLGLFYNSFPAVLQGYTDTSWITSTHDKMSTSKWIFILGSGVASWASKK